MLASRRAALATSAAPADVVLRLGSVSRIGSVITLSGAQSGLRQSPSNDLTRITPEREASLRGQARASVRTAPPPVTSPIPAAAPTPSEILRLQHLAGNRAVMRHLAGHTVPKVCVQRFFQESDAQAIFPRVSAFTTLDEKGRHEFRAALGVDESADDAIAKALREMFASIAAITLTHREGQRVGVSDMDVEIRVTWSKSGLLLKIASPPNVTFHNRTFGVIREIQFNGKVPSLYEDRIDIGRDYQGSGAGAIVTRSGLALAQALKINTITIEASDVGRYAWAAMGFEPNEGEWDRIASGMVTALERNVPEQWPQQTASSVLKRYPLPVEPKAAGDALAKEIREQQPDSPKLELDSELADAAIDALKPLFLAAAKTITDDDDFFGGKEPPERWIELLNEDDLAAYLARKALGGLLALTGFREDLTASFAPIERLAASTMSLGDREPTAFSLPRDAYERLMDIISPSTRAGHSLNDVVVLARALKEKDPRSAEFIRRLVMGSATWKGSAKLDDETVMKRFRTSVGWDG